MNLLPEEWKVPAAVTDRIGDHGGRQRIIHEDGHTLVILHFPPKAGEKEREPYFIYIKPDNTYLGYPNFLNPQDFVDSYYNRLKDLEEEYEKANTSEEYFTLLEHLVPLHLSSTRMHGALQMARDLKPKIRDILLWRDDSFENQRIAEILLTNTKNALDYCNAKSAEKMAEVSNQVAAISNRMNKMAYLFVPLMALGGIFGMNLKSGMDENNVMYFWTVIGAGAIIGFLNYLSIKK